jgi:uncharacterized RDD family membrane protein YckC
MSTMPNGGLPGQWSSVGPQDEPYPPPGATARHARMSSPVPSDETRVTGRRVLQYLLDGILSSIVPAILYAALDRGHGGRHVLSISLVAVLSVLCYAGYWVLRPRLADGQTFGMQLLRVRIISKDGGPASAAQLVIRWLALILDDLLAGLVGLVVMLLSEHRQRLGDHLARTLVVRAGWQGAAAGYQSAAAARPGVPGDVR